MDQPIDRDTTPNPIIPYPKEAAISPFIWMFFGGLIGMIVSAETGSDPIKLVFMGIIVALYLNEAVLRAINYAK